MSSIRSNFIYNLLYQTLLIVLPIVTAPYISRTLGADGLGLYTYSNSVATYFVLFSMLGVNNYGNREIARVRDNRKLLSYTFCSIWALQLCLSALFCTFYIIYTILFAPNYLCSVATLPLVVSAALDVNWLFFGLEEFRITVTRSFIVKLLTFALTFVVVKGPFAAAIYCFLISLSSLLSSIILWPFVKKHIDPVIPTLSEVVHHLKPNFVLFLPVVAVSFYTVLDKVMLGNIAGMAEAGVFENSFKVASMPFTIISALGTVMMPRASNLFAQGMSEKAIGVMAPSMWFALLLSSAFAFGLAAITPEFVPVFFGSGFEGCLIAMPLIVAEMPFKAWANVIRTQLLIPTCRDRDYVSSVVVGAIVNLLINLCLIRYLGAIGAAIATLFAEFAVCIVQTWAVRRELPISEWLVEILPGFCIGALMFIFIRTLVPYLPAGIIGLAIEILSGIICFTSISVIYYLSTKNSYATFFMNQLYKMFGNNKSI